MHDDITSTNELTLDLVPDGPATEEAVRRLSGYGRDALAALDADRAAAPAASDLPEPASAAPAPDGDGSGEEGTAPLQPPRARPRPTDPGAGDDLSFLDYVGDMLKGLANGPGNAVNETVNLAGTLLQGGEEFNVGETTGLSTANIFGKTRTAAGKFTEDLSTFVAGFYTGGKIMKGLNLLQGGSKAVTAARGMAKSAYSTFTGFDGHAEMLSNVIQAHPTLRNCVTEALAVSKDDSELEGRLKHTLEDLGIGVAAEFAISFVGMLRASKASTQAARDKILEETGERLRNAGWNGGDGASPAPFAASLDNGFLEQAGKEAAPRAQAMETGRLDPGGGGESITVDIPPGAKPLPETGAAPFTDSLDNGFLEQAGRETADAAVSPEAKAYLQGASDDILNAVNSAIRSSESREEVYARLANDWNIRTHLLHDDNDLRLMEYVHSVMEPQTLKSQGPETIKEVEAEAARLVEYDMPNAARILRDAFSGDIKLSETKYAVALLKDRISLTTQLLLNYARRLSVNPAAFSAQDKLDVVLLKHNLDSCYLTERNIATETGRALNFHKSTGAGTAKWVQSPPRKLTVEEAEHALGREGWTDENMKDFLADLLLCEGDLAKMVKAARAYRENGSWWHVLNEFRINNMLSGPITMLVNAASNTAKTLLMPAERYLGGLSMGAGGAEMRQEAVDALMGLYRYASESLRLGRRAGKIEDSLLDSLNGGVLEHMTPQTTYENIRKLFLRGAKDGAELSPVQEMIARSIGFVGPVLRWPGRVLMGTDEFFKQLNFRASLDAAYRREARGKGITDAVELTAHVESRMNAVLRGDGRLVRDVFEDDALAKNSLQYAREGTWTQALGRDTIGGIVQSAVQQKPSLRLILPFVRTPVNLQRDFVAHTPGINLLARRTREALRAGGEQAALEKAKMATGTMMLIPTFMLAESGVLTGTPPKDKKLREALEATGWQPYSIRIGDSYYSYRRMDPLGMFLGIAADLVTLANEKDDMTLAEATQGLLAALTNNITSKTYMQGFAEFMDFVNSPAEKGIQFMGRMGSTLIPSSSMFRFIRQYTDENMREMRDFTDYLLNTMPGFSETLPARRNWVTGEPYAYHFVGRDKKDMVLDEMNRMADVVPGMPAMTLRGVELTTAQHSRLSELHGTTTLGGKTLYEALRTLFESPRYDIDRQLRGDPPDKEQGPRALAIKRIVEAYRRKAGDDLLREDPELARRLRQSNLQRLLSKRGTMTTANQQELLTALQDY